MNRAIVARRKTTNGIFLSLSVLAAAAGILCLGFILWSLIVNGTSALSLNLFTHDTLSGEAEGGLANAIVGSLLMSGVAVAAGTPIGLLAGTYLAEYGRFSAVAFVVRFINDILLSAPSILIGLFIYESLVLKTWFSEAIGISGFSGWAGAAALTMIVIPVVVRTTENMLLLVPNSLREAAAALGAPRSNIIRVVTWRAARAGILTGLLLAIARISGETAPLLFTALGAPSMNKNMSLPMENLPHIISVYANNSDLISHAVAWAGALIITVTVLATSIVARILDRRS